MAQGKIVLELLQERIKNLDLLKDLLLQQQRALVATNADEVTHFAEMQVNCMEKIQSLENKWKELVDVVRTEKQLASVSSDFMISLYLDGDESVLAMAYLERVKKTVLEIENVKRNNAMLLNNSLSLVKSTLRNLQGDFPAASIYNPFRRQEHGHVLLNKKL